MTTKLSTTEKRDMDALVYLRNAGQWSTVTLADGRRAYGIPSRSRPNLRHITDGSDCSCEDRRRNGAECAHQRAAVLYRMERAATVAQPTTKYLEVFGDADDDVLLSVMAERRAELQRIGN